MKKTILFYIFCAIVLITTSFTIKPITPDDFFTKLETQLNINTFELQYDYPYCDTSIAYLVEQGYITPYQAYQLSNSENIIASSLIDRGFFLVGYFDRPFTRGKYKNIIDRVAKETGLVNESFDCSKPLNIFEAELIIDRLVSEDFKRIAYSKVECKINYTIDDFYGMSNSLQQTLEYIDMLPDSCIKEFNKQGYTLRIVQNANKQHPFGKNVEAFINLTTKEMFISSNYESSLFHEIAHIMLRKRPDKDVLLNKWYESEGKNISINAVQYNLNIEEYFSEISRHLFVYQNKKEYILQFSKHYPITYSFFQDIFFKTT